VAVGSPVYGVTNFPVAVNGQIAIPPGTYAQGQIDMFTRPGWLSPHAEIQIHFTRLIFANGYGVDLTQTSGGASDAAAYAGASDVPTAVATPYVNVSSASDVLLDNGSQIEMVLQRPVALDGAQIAAAVRDTKTRPPVPRRTASTCRPTAGTPGTPGTPDTVIPGTPATPPTVIPSGSPGVPDTVIPGSPGTPETVIPGTQGTPGTPGTICPPPPIVTQAKQAVLSGTFEIKTPMSVGGTVMAAGSYQAKWSSGAASGDVEIYQKGKRVASAHGEMVALYAKAGTTTPETRTNADGTVTLESLRFSGQAVALYFDESAPAAQ